MPTMTSTTVPGTVGNEMHVRFDAGFVGITLPTGRTSPVHRCVRDVAIAPP